MEWLYEGLAYACFYIVLSHNFHIVDIKQRV
jgi:hypothetical protein